MREWRIRRLKVKLAKEKARRELYREICNQNETVPWHIINKTCNAAESIACLEERIRQLEND